MEGSNDELTDVLSQCGRGTDAMCCVVTVPTDGLSLTTRGVAPRQRVGQREKSVWFQLRLSVPLPAASCSNGQSNKKNVEASNSDVIIPISNYY